MPRPTPFHERTQPLCTSYNWKVWSGYYAVRCYDVCHDREYNAFRQGSGLIDVTPLFKYDLRGPDAAALLSRITSRDIGKLKVGRVVYLCWCDDAGHVIDDGTCARLGEDHYRLTAAEPTYYWLLRHAGSFDVRIEDTSESLAAVALQGPTAAKLLAQISDADLPSMRFFGVQACRFERPGAAPGGAIEGWLTRTGYTGDLGYELWVKNEDAVPLWDTLMATGQAYGIWPCGLDALDICRVEAGFVMAGVDYTAANHAVIPSQKSTPFELGLGWTVNLGPERAPFIGQAALEREQAAGSKWAFVGLDISWEELERLYDGHGLPPHLPQGAWRTPTPVYSGSRQVGRATSGAWSPILKKNLALATVEARFAAPGTVIDFEVTVEWERQRVPATVTPLPFFDPPRKKAHGKDL